MQIRKGKVTKKRNFFIAVKTIRTRNTKRGKSRRERVNRYPINPASMATTSNPRKTPPLARNSVKTVSSPAAMQKPRSERIVRVGVREKTRRGMRKRSKSFVLKLQKTVKFEKQK